MNIIKSICCWGTQYCKCQFLRLSRNQNIKLSYIILILILLTISTTSIINKFKQTPTLISQYQCNINSTDQQKQQQCVRQQITFRWMFSIAFMHFVLVFFIMLRTHISKIFNQGIWLGKILFIVGFGFIGMYGLSNGVVNFMQNFAVYLVPIWYLIQNLIIIDLIYAIDNVFKQLTQKNDKFHLLKAFFAIIFVIGAVIINVLSYVHHRDTTQSLYISVLNSIYIGIFLIITLLRIAKGHTLFVFGLVMLYSNIVGYYLHCPIQQYTNSGFFIIQAVLIVISLFAILGQGSNKIRTRKSSLNQILALNTSKQEEDNRYVSSNKWIIFHIVFFIICITITWVVYQTGESFRFNENNVNQTGNLLRFYRILGWFFIIIIYTWTVIAAKLYPEQDFDQLENYFKEFQLN